MPTCGVTVRDIRTGSAGMLGNLALLLRNLIENACKICNRRLQAAQKSGNENFSGRDVCNCLATLCITVRSVYNAALELKLVRDLHSLGKKSGRRGRIFKTESKGVFICYRDSIAAAVMNAALDSGLRVPEDVEIISIVGTKYASIFRPTMSAMYIDMQEVGKRAMYMLTDLLNDSLVDKVSSFDADYIDGGSTLLKL